MRDGSSNPSRGIDERTEGRCGTGFGQVDWSMNRPDDPTDAIRRAVQVARAAGIEVVEDGLIEIVEVYGTRGQEVIAMFGPKRGRSISTKSMSTGGIRPPM
jgi:hypothetical protein